MDVRTLGYLLMVAAVTGAGRPDLGVAQEGKVALEITLEHDSEGERQTAELLRELVAEYDIERWIETRRVHVDEEEIPHSHPVLTVHTRSRNAPHHLLATFLHEQFHWLEDSRREDFHAAMDRYAELFPDAPEGSPLGGRDQRSTWRHLLVCDLEFQAMTELVGEERAREVLGSNRHYVWIYEQVLTNPVVREVAAEHGFLL